MRGSPRAAIRRASSRATRRATTSSARVEAVRRYDGRRNGMLKHSFRNRYDRARARASEPQHGWLEMMARPAGFVYGGDDLINLTLSSDEARLAPWLHAESTRATTSPLR